MRERGWNENVMRMKYYNMNNDNVAVRLTVSGSVHAKSLPASFRLYIFYLDPNQVGRQHQTSNQDDL